MILQVRSKMQPLNSGGGSFEWGLVGKGMICMIIDLDAISWSLQMEDMIIKDRIGLISFYQASWRKKTILEYQNPCPPNPESINQPITSQSQVVGLFCWLNCFSTHLENIGNRTIFLGGAAVACWV